jgi:hypothetical protein
VGRGHENEAQEEGHAPSSVNTTIIDTSPSADLVKEVRDELEVLGNGSFGVAGACPRATDAVGV